MNDPGTLEVTARCRLGSFTLDVTWSAERGETVALVGPNGSGKTTLLHVLAGIRPLETGRIVLDGTVLEDPAAGIWVPPEDRGVAIVFQDNLLFPHLSAVDNVAFGLRARGSDARTARARAQEWLEQMDLGERADARPGELSGGQAQRVALARALATEPELLLLDEPLSALDVRTRQQLRELLSAHLATYPGIRILVTHDPADAAALADRTLRIENGSIVSSETI